MKTCIILRGLPGSGKSSFARFIRDSDPHRCLVEIVSADDYFTDIEGNYNFEIGKLDEAHAWCAARAHAEFADNTDIVIIDNTNCRVEEFNWYKETAEEHGYQVFVVLVENHHGNKSIHAVPERTLVRREALLRNSIKLR